MIRIGNRKWRTLEQPLYVNGKKVLEVWADDHLVYPENTGEFIKIRGKISFNEAYGEDEMGYSYPGDVSHHQPAYSGVFSGTAEFAACFRCLVGTEYRPFVLTNNHRGGLFCGPKYCAEGLILNDIDHWIAVGYKTVSGKTIGLKQFRDAVHYTPWYTGKIIYRQNISAFPILPEVTKSTWAYGYADTGYSYTAQIVNPSITEHTAFNGVIYKQEYDELSTFFGIKREIGGINLRANLWYTGSDHGPCLDVGLEDFVRPNGVRYTDIMHYGTPEPDQTEDLRIGVYPLFSVPVTDIMYLGSYYAAPEEMRDVTVADLNF